MCLTAVESISVKGARRCSDEARDVADDDSVVCDGDPGDPDDASSSREAFARRSIHLPKGQAWKSTSRVYQD